MVFKLCSEVPWGFTGDYQGFNKHIFFIVKLVSIILISFICIPPSHNFICILFISFHIHNWQMAYMGSKSLIKFGFYICAKYFISWNKNLCFGKFHFVFTPKKYDFTLEGFHKTSDIVTMVLQILKNLKTTRLQYRKSLNLIWILLYLIMLQLKKSFHQTW